MCPEIASKNDMSWKQGQSLEGGRGQTRFSQKPKFVVIFLLKPSLRGSENFHYPLVYKMDILWPWRDFYGFLGRYWAILSEHMFEFNVLDFRKIL